MNKNVPLCPQKLKSRYAFRVGLLLTRTNEPSRVLVTRGDEVEHKIVCRGRMSVGTLSSRRNEGCGFGRWRWSIGEIFSDWKFERASEYYKPPGKNKSSPLAISFLGEHTACGIQDQ